MTKRGEFQLPYTGMDKLDGLDLVYGLNGEFSVVMQITNPLLQYSGSVSAYRDYHGVFAGLLKALGTGYLLQKQDVICRHELTYAPAQEYLQDRYHRHFAGRKALRVYTYLTITRPVRKGAFFSYDPVVVSEFSGVIAKVKAVLEAAGFVPRLLDGGAVDLLVKRMLAMEFSAERFSLGNIAASDRSIEIGFSARSMSLVDIDKVELPALVGCHAALSGSEALRGFPVDLFSFLLRVPDFHCIVYNQLIEVPSQPGVLRKLALKRKRHSGIPDPANLLCVQDIDALLEEVARDSQLLVNAHFNVMVCAERSRLEGACNFIESELFSMGIVPSQNAYNQLELFRTALPGNGVELKAYDWFLTSADAALCFLFKERMQADEPSDFLVRFTDRTGVPVGIDVSDLPMAQNRMSNRSRFVLGGSGTGKSFFMNALLEQYMRYAMDVVVIDTGHSYSGLCSYFGGRYITYEEGAPITMNPFALSEAELNIEKKDFLVTLIILLWKGAEGSVTQMESDVIRRLVSGYYRLYFSNEGADELDISVSELSFNSFYEYALAALPLMREREEVPFDLVDFRFLLQKFYRGGEFDALLNKATDGSLFSERFIVFEIDNIKDSRVLFPIVTLIIMDVFLQKMRFRSDRRKCLVVEEAWKAIASPLMAGYLLYLYKTVRKFWGEAIVVTQELGDILGNPIVKDSIIANSGTICLLDQGNFRDNFDEIARLLSISEVERRKIFTINQLDNKSGRGKFKEVYIRRGMTGEVYGVEVSLEQYLCYTTEKPEKRAVEVYVSRYGSYPAALDAMIRDMHELGLPFGNFIARVNAVNAPLRQV